MNHTQPTRLSDAETRALIERQVLPPSAHTARSAPAAARGEALRTVRQRAGRAPDPSLWLATAPDALSPIAQAKHAPPPPAVLGVRPVGNVYTLRHLGRTSHAPTPKANAADMQTMGIGQSVSDTGRHLRQLPRERIPTWLLALGAALFVATLAISSVAPWGFALPLWK